MKVLKERSRKYKDKTYYKYKINLPEEKLIEAGIKSGDELELFAKKGEIKLVKK